MRKVIALKIGTKRHETNDRSVSNTPPPSFDSFYTRLFPHFIKYICKFSIRRRLIAFFLLFSTVPVFMVGTGSYLKSRQAVIDKSTNYSLENLLQSAAHLEKQIEKYQDLGFQLQFNLQNHMEIKDYIVNRSPAARESIQKLFDDFLGFDTSVKCMLLGAVNGQNLVGVGNLNLATAFTELKENPVYKEALANPGQLYWGVTGTDLFMVRLLTDLSTDDPLAVYTVVFNGQDISQTLNKFAFRDSDAYSALEMRYSIIVNTDGEILCSPHLDQIGAKITDLLQGNTISTLFEKNPQESGFFFDRSASGKVLVTYNRVPSENWYLLGLAHHDFLFKEVNNAGFFILIIELLMIFLSFGLSYGVFISISLPLDQLKEAMAQAANGNLTYKVKIDTMDELNALGYSFNEMTEQIGELIQETKNAAAAVSEHSKLLESSSRQSAQTAEAVAQASTEITKGTIEQTAEAEKTARQMTVLAEEIDVAATKFSDVELVSNHTRNLSTQSKSIMDELILKSNETNRITKTITDDITELNKGSEEIRNVTDLIANIAEQTNLLALNAAIEAARAHEVGAGFAVVADEVNKLANRTNTAAKAINDILKTIEERARNSTANVAKAREIVLDQLNVVAQTQQTFDEIIQGMDLIVNRITDVNNHVQRIKAVKDETSQSILNISAISEETAASSEEVSASIEEQAAITSQVKGLADELKALADKLVNSITKFTV